MGLDAGLDWNDSGGLDFRINSQRVVLKLF